MKVESIVDYIMSLMTHFSDTILAFALFRMTMNRRSIIWIGLIWGTLSYYFRFILETPYFPMLNLVTFLVLLMVFKHYPIFYAFLVSAITFVVYAVIEAVYSIIIFELELTSIAEIEASSLHFVFANTGLCTLYIVAAYLLKKYRIGFSLIIGNYRKMQAFKPYNFIWAASLVTFVFIIQLFVSMDLLNFHKMILVIITLAAYMALYFSYTQNKKEMLDRKMAKRIQDQILIDRKNNER